VPLPTLADLVSGVAKIAANHDVMISVIAHAGGGNTHPLIVYDPTDAAMAERAQNVVGEIMDLASHVVVRYFATKDASILSIVDDIVVAAATELAQIPPQTGPPEALLAANTPQ
jgi:FAD linked oxidases, C-terminal domain